MTATDDFSQPITVHQYAKQWRQYKLLQTIVVGFFVSFLPAAIGFKFFFDDLFSNSDKPMMIAAFGWMAAFAVAAWRLGSFRCPRCGEQFFNRKGFAFFRFYQPFSKHCWSCGLEKWAGE